MAELFLAQEPPKPGLVVIKRILPYLSDEAEFVQMFLDEARIAAQLHHPNIVQVHELGKLNDSIFIAMEYVAGADLRRLMSEESKFGSSVPYAVAARICAGVAAGLEYAHTSVGVDGRPLELIHRDVSPQNVVVGFNGQVKLVDFGIAKAGAFVERSKPGVIKGKFLYLSPEQVMQERLDHRADVFALGTMLYEITTGRSPFTRPTTEAILYAIRFEMPSPPHLLRDDYPQELSRIVMKCLVKDRNQRYQRAAQVQADLEALLASGAMRQSDSVEDYIARLLGEEGERTVLHIPSMPLPPPPPRKGAPATPPPPSPPPGPLPPPVATSPGLASLPTRRPGATNLAPAIDESAEPSTQMVTPDDLAGMEAEEEPDTRPENRLPGRRVTPLSVPERPSRPSPTLETSQESTLSERGPRQPPVLPKRPPTPEPNPAARARRFAPTPPDPMPAVDRRRGPPVLQEVEEVEEAESSQSLTASTVNERPSSRLPVMHFDEDSLSDSRSGTGSDMTEPLSAATEREPEEDESTAGFTFTGTESNASTPVLAQRSRTGLWLGLVLLGVLIAGAAVWFLWLGPSLQPPPPPPMEATPLGTAPGSELTAGQPGTGAPSGAVGEAPPPDSEPELVGLVEDTDGGQEEADAGAVAAETEGEDAGTVLAEADAGTGAEAAPVVEAPTFPVRIQSSSRTQLRIGGQKVRPNTTLQLPAGLVEVQYTCPGKRRRTTEFIVPESPEGPVVFTVNCRLKGSR
jgi:serine/threonine-protein kinase